MEINYTQILPLLIAWADGADPDSRIRGRESVGDEIARAAARLGIAGGLQAPDSAKALHNNQQRIFRWAAAETVAQQRKIAELYPAIIDALPEGLSAQLLARDSLQYRALQAAERSVKTAMKEFVRANKAIAIQELLAERQNDAVGSSSESCIYH